jgi:hypothetical protein
MFGLFKSLQFRDQRFGDLARLQWHWRGALMLDAGPNIPLAIFGTRTEPAAQALAVVRDVVAQYTSELGYTTDWDEEHTLGARFQTGKFIELCGSMLPP